MNNEQLKLLEELRINLNNQDAIIAAMLHRLDMAIAMMKNSTGETK